MSYQPPPPHIHYHYQVPPPTPPRRNITRWILLGVGLGVMLCVCSTLYVSCVAAQRQQAALAVPSLTNIENRDATATAEEQARLTAPDGAPSNPWGYNYEPEVGHYVYNDPPTFCSYFKCAHPFGTANDGFVVEYNDGLYMHNGGHDTACDGHGGVRHALYWH
jgi:hypothetical protein